MTNIKCNLQRKFVSCFIEIVVKKENLPDVGFVFGATVVPLAINIQNELKWVIC